MLKGNIKHQALRKFYLLNQYDLIEGRRLRTKGPYLEKRISQIHKYLYITQALIICDQRAYKIISCCKYNITSLYNSKVHWGVV